MTRRSRRRKAKQLAGKTVIRSDNAAQNAGETARNSDELNPGGWAAGGNSNPGIGATKLAPRRQPREQDSAQAVLDTTHALPAADITDSAPNRPLDEKALPTSARCKAMVNERNLAAAGYETVQVSQALPPGTRIGGDYFIGMVTSETPRHLTYAAYDENLDIPVLIREFYPAEYVTRRADGMIATFPGIDEALYQAAAQRFLERGRALVRFRHPNIIRARRLIEENNTSYLVLDFDYGQTLHSWLKSLARQPSQTELDQLTAPLLDAVALIHRTGNLHRNINPDTIFIRKDGSVLLRGFESLAQARNDDPLGRGQIEASYAAPEVAGDQEDRQGPWSDIYGIAAVLHQAVSGIDPENPTSRTGNKLPCLADLAPEIFRSSFLETIDNALAVNPDDRPQSIDVWMAKLGCIVQAEPDDNSVGSDEINSAAGEMFAKPAAGDQQTLLRSRSATTRKISLPDAAAEFLTRLSLREDEAGAPGYGYESLLLPVGVVAGIIGTIIIAAGGNIALATVLQTIAASLFLVKAYLPMYRSISLPTHSVEQTLTRAENATTASVLSIALLFLLLSPLPFLAQHFVPTELPLSILAFIFMSLAALAGLFRYLGTPLRGGLKSWAFGTVNFIIFLFAAIFSLSVVIASSGGQLTDFDHDIMRSNRYVLGLASFGILSLSALNFICRFSAKQRLRQKGTLT